MEDDASLSKVSEGLLLQLDGCIGKLRWNAAELPIAFSLVCRPNGAVVISASDIPVSNESKFLWEIEAGRGHTLENFTISGVSADGIRIHTDHAYFTECGTRSDQTGDVFALKASSNLLDVTWPGPPLNQNGGPYAIEYLIPGLDCLGVASAQASFGTVTVRGSARAEDYDCITGTLAVESKVPEQLLAQPEDLDRNVRLILDILSFAEGRFMDWSIRKTIIGGKVCSARLSGARGTTEPQFPVFSYLNLEPVLRVALEKYTRQLCDKTGIDLAIEWFLMHPRYSELRFITGMTALEHMIHVFSERNPLLPKTTFRKFVRPRVESELRAAVATLQNGGNWTQEVEIMAHKLGDLNRRPLQENLKKMLQHYQVPLRDLVGEIPKLIQLRNDIVHIGHRPRSPDNPGLAHYNSVLRELLTRIFLTHLEYEGQYQSFLSGPEWVAFPPTEETT